MRGLVVALSVLLAACGGSSYDSALYDSPGIQNAAERTYDIGVECRDGSASGGSAIYLSEGRALTAYHVMSGLDNCEATLTDDKGQRYKGFMIEHDKSLDVALLVTTDDRAFWPTEMRWGRLGEPVVNVGYPMHPSAMQPRVLSVTTGTFSERRYKRHRVTAPCFFGNSGGGTWSVRDNKLLGMTVSTYAQLDGFCYVTPAELIQRWLDGE